jgi:GlpG protein
VQDPRQFGSLRIAAMRVQRRTRPLALTPAERFLHEELNVRLIGTIPRGLDARIFTDYLLTLGIKTRLDEGSDSWNLWVYNEDQIPRASTELRNFLSRPEDPLYRDANQAAQAIRRQEQALDKQFRKNYREVSDQWAAPAIRRRPLTVALIAICLAVFVIQHSGRQEARRIEHRLLFATTRLDANGQQRNNGLSDIVHGEVWRLVTPIFMHVNILHIFFNMGCLSAFGTLIETRRGTLRFAVIVLTSAILSNLGQFFYNERNEPGDPVLWEGMSGVGYALFGYIWMKALHEPEQGLFMHPNTVSIMLFWLVLCMTGWIGPIANAAHVAGLVVGVVFGVFRF